MKDKIVRDEFKKLTTETCELLGIERQQIQTHYEIWQLICEELPTKTLNKILSLLTSFVNLMLHEITMKKIILQELQKRGQAKQYEKLCAR